jgi:hypothetical protein
VTIVYWLAAAFFTFSAIVLTELGLAKPPEPEWVKVGGIVNRNDKRWVDDRDSDSGMAA